MKVKPKGAKTQAADTGPEKTPDVPSAVLKRERRWSLTWLLPLLAIIVAGWLGYQSWIARGVLVTVEFDQGHGIDIGDDVRFRSAVIGEVRDVQLDDQLDRLVITLALQDSGERFARAGTRFWVVRPEVGLKGVAGIETLIGPRYIAMLPGDGGRRSSFVGLAESPVVSETNVGDLQIIVEAAQRGGLRRGAPVVYRQVPVGAVLSVGLASDAGAVEARLHIEKQYAQLVRTRTRFWSTSGLSARVGLGGLSVEMESLQALLAGGVSLATPDNGGDLVSTGHRFRLDTQPPQGWLEWQPLAVIGSSFLPPGAPMPKPMRATLGWEQGRVITRSKSTHGWVLQTSVGLVGPIDLLEPGDKADRATIVLEVNGEIWPLDADGYWDDGHIALRQMTIGDAEWDADRRRIPDGAEDALIVADPSSTPRPLAASRITDRGDHWTIDAAVSLDEAWHGAAVVARSDGLLLGVIVIDEDDDVDARVAFLPAK